jgi:peptide/nickel transport system permease protein
VAPHRRGRRAWRRFRRRPEALAAVAVLISMGVVGALAPQIAPQGWNRIDLASRWHNHPPTLSGWHLAGTDNVGRDVLIRSVYGLHASERTALPAALAALALGVALGAIAGYRGGWIDALLMRLADLVSAFPALMLLYAAYIFLEPVTNRTAATVFALYMWTGAARVVRAQITSLRNTDFIEAARAIGASDTRIVARHLIPNGAGTILVAATSLLGQIILLEATVEFFGLGVPSQTQPTLGNLIGDATASGIGNFNQLGLGWWTWATPATILVLILITLNITSDTLDTTLNPTTIARSHRRPRFRRQSGTRRHRRAI